MIKNLLLVVLTWYCLDSVAQPLQAFKPAIWLSGSEGTTGIKWVDISGNNTDATAARTEEFPANGLLNYNPVFTFDGVNDYVSLAHSLENLSSYTVIVVFQSADTTERGIWGDVNGTNRKALLTTKRVLGPDAISDVYRSNESWAVINSTVQVWDKTGISASDATLALGSTSPMRTDKLFKGKIAEFILFDRALEFMERIQIETYLAIKYGISLRHQNYVSSASKLLWSGEKDKGYAGRMAGIGRDDFFKLNQKQSASVYDTLPLVSLSVGAIAKTNSENTTQINNQDFLIWGDNSASLQMTPGNGADSVLMVSARKWMMRASGATANNIPTEVYLDAKQLPQSSNGYWLVIDRSGTGNFSVDNLEYVKPSRVATDGKIVYSVKWDTDQSGGDAFAFAKAQNLFVVVRTLASPSCTDETAGKISIEVISGKSAYGYSLTCTAQETLNKSWRTTNASVTEDNLVASSYVLTISDGNGEKLKRNFSLTSDDALHIDIGEDQKLTQGKDIVLDISNQIPDSVAVTYKWISSYGFTSDSPKITIHESGVYQVTVTKVSDGCVFKDEVAISGSESQRLNVYPTAIHDEIYNVSISLPEPGVVNVRVYSSGGVLTREVTGSNKAEYHFTGSLKESGMYLVVIQTPYGKDTRKVVVY